MKIRVDSVKLSEALRRLMPFVVTRGNKPILGNVLLTAVGGKLLATATTLERSIEVEIVCEEILRHGATLISQAALAQAASADCVVSLEAAGGSLAIVTRIGRSQLQTEAADKFPEFPAVPAEAASVSVDAKWLVAAMKGTVFAAAGDASRYCLDASRFEHRDGRLVVVSTDGRCLAMRESPSAGGGEFFANVPTASAIAITKALADCGEKVTVAADANWAHYTAAGVRAAARLCEGKYPNHAAAVPKDDISVVAAFKATDMSEAMQHVSLIAAGRDCRDSSELRITFGDNSISLSTESADVGNSVATMPAACDASRAAVVVSYSVLLGCTSHLVDNARLEVIGEIAVRIAHDGGFMLVMQMNGSTNGN